MLSSTVLASGVYAALWASGLYVIVHTDANPGGELRGQFSTPIYSYVSRVRVA